MCMLKSVLGANNWKFTCCSSTCRILFRIPRLLEHAVGCYTQCIVSSTAFDGILRRDAHSLPKKRKFSNDFSRPSVHRLHFPIRASLSLTFWIKNLPPCRVPRISGEDDSGKRSFSCPPRKRLIFLMCFPYQFLHRVFLHSSSDGRYGDFLVTFHVETVKVWRDESCLVQGGNRLVYHGCGVDSVDQLQQRIRSRRRILFARFLPVATLAEIRTHQLANIGTWPTPENIKMICQWNFTLSKMLLLWEKVV